MKPRAIAVMIVAIEIAVLILANFFIGDFIQPIKISSTFNLTGIDSENWAGPEL